MTKNREYLNIAFEQVLIYYNTNLSGLKRSNHLNDKVIKLRHMFYLIAMKHLEYSSTNVAKYLTSLGIICTGNNIKKRFNFAINKLKTDESYQEDYRIITFRIHQEVGKISKTKTYYDDDTVMKIIESADLNFALGNVVKYCWRAGKKSESKLEDLKKAKWYLDREISNSQI